MAGGQFDHDKFDSLWQEFKNQVTDLKAENADLRSEVGQLTNLLGQ